MENENRNKTDWLKELANDESLWEERVYEEMPAVIAYEYRRLHEMAAEGNVYGTMLQMKDVCEIILKYPMILGLCILKEDNKPDDIEFYREVISLIFSDVPMSLGKWVDKVRCLKKRQLPKILFQILDRTLELFSQEIGGYANIPNWRNLTIGHGVLRSEDDIGLQTEMKTLLLLLKCYFNSGILDEYTHIVLTQGTTPLIGESATKLQSNEPFFLRINQNGQKSASIGALEYIFPSDHKIYFFDSYRKPKTTFLDYVEGIPLFVKHGFFNEFYEELKKSDMISKKTAEMVKSSDTYLTKATNKLMDELDKPPIFEPPLYIYNWFSDQIRQNINGCLILQLGRGLGKAALASNMSTNHIEASCVVRTYHCFRSQIRTADDFLTKIKRIFLDTGKSSDEIEDIQGLHEYTDIKRQDWDAQATANLLNFLAAFYQKEKGIQKLVLVIDGIDEIVDLKMFDLFPKQGNLADGVYVLYTTRPVTEDEIADASLRTKIQSMNIDEDKCCSENSEEHQKVVLAYAQKEMQQTYHRGANSTEYIELAKKAGYNFLKLRVLIPVYCSSNTMDIASLPGGEAMVGAFLGFLEDNYGKKFFNNRVLPVLIALSIFYDGLSFDDLAHLLEDRENRLLLAAALNDLKGVLSVERSSKGNVYKLANEEYVQYINENYPEEFVQSKNQYHEIIFDLHKYLEELSDEEWGEHESDRRKEAYQSFPQIKVLRPKLLYLDLESNVTTEFLEMLLDIDEWLGFDLNADEDFEYLSVFQWIIEKINKEGERGQSAAWLWYQVLDNPNYSRLRWLSDCNHLCGTYFEQLIAEEKVDEFSDFFWLAYDMSSMSDQSDSQLRQGKGAVGGGLKYNWVFSSLVCQAWRKNEFDQVLLALSEEERNKKDKRHAIYKIFDAITPAAIDVYKWTNDSCNMKFFERIREVIDKNQAIKCKKNLYELTNLLLNLCLFLPFSFSRTKLLYEKIACYGYRPRFVYTGGSGRRKNQIGAEDAERIFNLAMEAVANNKREEYLRIVDSISYNDTIPPYRIWDNPVCRLAVSSKADLMCDDEMWDMVNGTHPIYQMYAKQYEKALNLLDHLLKNEKSEDDSLLQQGVLHCSMLRYFQLLYPAQAQSVTCREFVTFVSHSKEEPGDDSGLWKTFSCFALLLDSVHVFPKMIEDFSDKIFGYFMTTLLLVISAIQDVYLKRKCLFFDLRNLK